jgi:uncharacterized protein (DUF1800 family)
VSIVLNRALPAATLFLAAFLAGHAPAQEPGQESSRPAPDALTEDEQVSHVLSRFTLGASADLHAAVRRQGWRPWLKAQLAARASKPAGVLERMKPFPSLQMTLPEIWEQYGRRRGQAKTAEEKKAAQRLSNEPRKEVLVGTVISAVYDDVPVRQAAADFFRNHFSVDITKGNLKLFLTTWERDLIQGQSLGNFGDLLDATARHPAMLFFLDNHLSRRPVTPEELERMRAWAAKRGKLEQAERRLEIAAQRGLNENYARELLELHTLGVDNYYTQEDIINVAKCLTGWTIARPKAQPRSDTKGFWFARNMHSGGDKPFLDGVVKANPADPEAEGQQVLDTLKAHPGTARFLAWKLCRWFVNDNPSDAMVQRVAAVFTKTQGDLAQVFLAIAEDPEFCKRENFRVKFKRPWEYVISALRVTGADVQHYRGVLSALEELHEPLYRCADPAGYYGQAEAWCDPGALAPRWAFANDLVSGRLRGVRVPPALFSGLPEDTPEEWVGILAGRILPGGNLSKETHARIDAMVEGMAKRKKRGKSRPALVARLIVASLIGSPDFQKQ